MRSHKPHSDGSLLAAHVGTLQVQVQQAPFVHHDDTGWRIGTQNATMSVCTREEYAQQGESLILRLDALLNRAPLKSKANERLRLDILKQDVLDRLWRFPPTFPRRTTRLNGACGL